MTKRFKKLIASIAFLLILSFILGIFSLILKPKSNTKEAGFYHPSAYSICNEPENTIDILFLGTSHVYSSFIPMEIWKNLGITSYLCSTPSQPLYYTEEFLHKAFENQSPSLVVLETDAIFEKFNETDIINHKLENQFSLLRYHSRWKELTTNDFVLSYDYSHRHTDKGFTRDFRHQKIVKFDYMIPTDDVKNISDFSIYYLERIIDFCNKKNTKLILVSSLSAANWDYSKHNAIVNITNQYNLEYFDCNLYLDEIDLDWDSDWLDEGKHLNYYGALKFTTWFQKYLPDFNSFVDRREDPSYSFWYNDLNDLNDDIKAES